MTQNQIAYWNLQETKRSNVSKEGETARHNRATESEDKRHNVSVEGETNRHNVATENFNISQLNENIRHNTVSEQQNATANEIKSKANAINEAYNAALLALRGSELTLAQQKEKQRIEESQRDFNEGVRMNDAKLIVDAFGAGSDAVRTIFGNKGLVGAGLLGAGLFAGGTAATKMAEHELRSDIFKPKSGYTNVSNKSGASRPGGFDLFLIPNTALEIFENTLYTPNGRTGSSSTRWN